MTVRFFLISSVVAALISWLAWAGIVSYLDPTQAGWLGLLLFFLALFLAVASSSALVGYGIRRVVTRDQLAAYAVRTSLRQGVLFGLFLSMLLIMQLMQLYRWWLALIATVLFLSAEFVWLSYEQSGVKSR